LVLSIGEQFDAGAPAVPAGLLLNTLPTSVEG